MMPDRARTSRRRLGWIGAGMFTAAALLGPAVGQTLAHNGNDRDHHDETCNVTTSTTTTGDQNPPAVGVNVVLHHDETKNHPDCNTTSTTTTKTDRDHEDHRDHGSDHRHDR